MNWQQFRAILWVRWRLTRNQLRRAGTFGAIIGAVAGVALVVFAVGAGIAATLVGALALKAASATVIMFSWDAVVAVVLFFSFLGILTELQRSESVDLARLLHLPISLKQVFVFNYLVSLVSLGTVLGLAVMLGLATGLTIARGPQFVLMVPVAMAFMFMVTAWIYCLRGWLLSLMVNPRRRRSIIMWITLGFILISQSPQLLNLAWQRKARTDREARRAAQGESEKKEPGNQSANAGKERAKKSDENNAHVIAVATQVHLWVPPLWLPNGARGVAAGEILPALWGGAGMLVLGWLGLSRAYRATLRFYRSDERAKPIAVQAPSLKPARPAHNWVERQLPWIPPDATALALAQFRSMTRAPEVRIMLSLGLFLAIFLPMMIFWRGGSPVRFPDAGRPFMGTFAVVMVLFSLLQLVCNQFGCDRNGFRSLVLLPTPRNRLLLGKNLALLPLASGIALLPLAAISVFAKLSALVVAATIFQFAAAFLLFCALGNVSSILAPFRVAAGSLKPTKQSWQTVVAVLLAHLLFPLVIAPVFIPPVLGWGVAQLGWLPAAPVNLLAAMLLVVVFAILYGMTLRPLGRMLQRRETHILLAVTEVME